MCGIVGIFDTYGTMSIDEALLARMNELQFHRGPDEGGQHVEEGLGLGHRRLSIIDLSGGHQPLFNEDGNVCVVYNGEIYNYRELTDVLIKAGHTFRTRCDTEVIVHAWEEWGEKCVERFRGMFAFAVWDKRKQTLFLARDRLGIKPLHYSLLPDGRLLFASEIKSLLADPLLPRTVDPFAVEEYFAFGYIPDPRSIFDCIHKLPAGHTLLIERGQPFPHPKMYWDVPFNDNGVRVPEEARRELVDRLRDAVNIRLISEVPLGAFLSGGVDSSAVVALMAGLSDDPVNTCSISFGDPAFNESEYAAMVAEQYHTRHQVGNVNPDDFSLIDRLATLYDEPYADSSAIPTYRVCELAKRRVTVALSGDGGDENFAGYSRYRWHMDEERIRRMLPGWMRKSLFGGLGRVYPKVDWAPRIFRAKSTLQALGRDSITGYFHNFSILPDALRQKLYSDTMKRALNGYNGIEVFRGHLDRAPDHPLSKVQYLDFKTYLSGDILTKVDRASMAHALEVRVPVLDHEFVEWVSGLQPSMKLHRREGKVIFKNAMERYLPHDILYRRKMGFAVPLANWFRGPLRERVRDSLLGPSLMDTGYFNQDFIRKLVDQHQSGQRDHSAIIWSLLMFESFQRQVLQS